MADAELNQSESKASEPIHLPVLTPEEENRRAFFTRLIVGLSGAIGLAGAIPFAGFVIGPLLRKKTDLWRSVGAVDSFKQGDTVLVHFENASARPWAGVTAQSAAWLRRESGEQFIAFSVNCRHLGCPVRWVAGSELFLCPCHGGVYYKDGSVAAGPPPEALARYEVRVRDGQVEIKTAPLPLTIA